MKFSDIFSIKILPSSVTQTLYDRIESNTYHLSYKVENQLFSCVKEGNVEKLFDKLKLFNESIVVGQMSENDLRQYKYMAVSSITLATRYAIDGGLNESDAYSFSDGFIRKIDALDSPEMITEEICLAVIQLTNSVAEEKSRLKFSPYVRKCIAYINKNINKKITVKDLAQECGISQDYLSHIFKKEIGEKLSSYILKCKLGAAKTLLLEGLSNNRIADTLGFSSESHFISVFKKQYGITPKKFVTIAK